MWKRPSGDHNRQCRSSTTREMYGPLIFKVPPPSVTAKCKSSKCVLWLAASTISERQSSRLTAIFSCQDISHHWSCLCRLESPSLLPERSICTNPPSSWRRTMTSLINYPCVRGGTERWRQQMGKWVFPLQINVYEVCIWHFISTPGWGPSGRTLAEHVVCQPPGYLGWLGKMPFIWNAQSVWEREHNHI